MQKREVIKAFSHRQMQDDDGLHPKYPEKIQSFHCVSYYHWSDHGLVAFYVIGPSCKGEQFKLNVRMMN